MTRVLDSELTVYARRIHAYVSRHGGGDYNTRILAQRLNTPIDEMGWALMELQRAGLYRYEISAHEVKIWRA